MVIRLTDPSVELGTNGAALEGATRLEHQQIVSAGSVGPSGSSAPTPTEVGALLYLVFDQPTDRAFRVFKIKYNYVGSPSFHIHWTKPNDSDSSGKFVKWRIDYVVFDGHDEDAASSTFVESEDLEYIDSGTTTRIVYRSANLPVTGFVAGSYVSIKISTVTPDGTELVDPGLVTVDLIYEALINRGN